jgi:hypothetical protein
MYDMMRLDRRNRHGSVPWVGETWCRSAYRIFLVSPLFFCEVAVTFLVLTTGTIIVNVVLDRACFLS